MEWESQSISHDTEIGHVNEYPTMRYIGNPRDTQSMIAYIILTEYFYIPSEKLHCGNVVNMTLELE